MAVACGLIYDSIKYSKVVASASFLYKDLEYKNKLGFALLSADFSRTAAQASALGFTDTDVDTAYAYIYRLSLSHAPADIPIDTLYVEMRYNKTVITSPNLDHIEKRDSSIMLYWERPLNSQLFTAYNIERSDTTGKVWTKLNKDPYIYALNSETDQNEYNIFEDRDVVKGMNYSYRLIGLTPFGETAPPSDTMRIFYEKNQFTAAINDLNLTWLDDKKVKLTWKVEDDKNQIKGFIVTRSTKPQAGFEPLDNKALSSSVREYNDEDVPIYEEYYYKVYAFDMYNQVIESHAVYTHRNDKTPPEQPQGLTGHIDRDGKVSLSWNFGKDEDLMGYKVYFSNDSTHVFTLFQNELLRDTVFSGKITLNSLTRHIYFRIKAIDMRYNESKMSRMVELFKPDTIPPMAAELIQVFVKDTTAELYWTTSRSKDADQYILLRSEGKSDFKEVWKTSDIRINHYKDRGLHWGHSYNYELVTLDDSGNKEYSTITSNIITPNHPRTKPQIFKFEAKYEKQHKTVNLSWNIPLNTAKQVVVYKYAEKDNLVKKRILKPQNSWQDNGVEPGRYKYALSYWTADFVQSQFVTVEVLCD